MKSDPSDILPRFERDARVLALAYAPPAVATLVAPRNVAAYRRMEEWSAPPGWRDPPSILDFPIRPAHRPGLRFRTLGRTLSVHDPETLDTHGLNETAAPIFLLCDGLRSVREICAAYARIFELDGEAAAADVRRILSELFEKKILVARRAEGAPKPRPTHSSPLPTLS